MSENEDLVQIKKRIALLEEEKSELVKRVKDLSLQGKEKTNLIKSLFDNLPNGVVMFDQDRNIVQINQVAAEMFCQSKRLLIGRNCAELFDCYKKNKACPVLDQGTPLIKVRTHSYCSDLTLVRSAVLNLVDGSRVVVETLVDISEMEQATREKIIALQTKSNFLANFSHELRTPMHGIIGFSNLLMLKKDEVPESVASYIETMDQSVNRMWDLIEKLFDASNLEVNSIELKQSSFSLSTFMSELESGFSLLHDNHLNKVVFDCKADDINLRTDKQRLLQAVMSLLENASKYTNNGLIECTADTFIKNDILFLKIAVRDNGIGIAEKNQENIFNFFEQGDGSSTRAYQGSGLGLAIARQLAVLMGGDISLESELGKGSEFTLSVPVDILGDTV